MERNVDMIKIKQIKPYVMYCIILLISIISISCSNEKVKDTVIEHESMVKENEGQDQREDQEDQEENQEEKSDTISSSDMISETTMDDIIIKDPESKEELDNEFLSNFYEFTERTSAHIFCNKSNDNQIYAPLNWYLTLYILGEMSEGDARSEIVEALGVSEIDHTQVTTAISVLENRKFNRGRLNVNNSLWLSDELNYHKELLDKLISQYETEVYQGNLKDYEFQNMISQWVYENTNHQFMPEYNNLSNLTDPYTFILLNTLDFYNEWIDPFNEEETSVEEFFLSDNNIITCDFMQKEEETYPFKYGEDYIVMSLNLIEYNETMLFILPDEGLLVEDFLEEKGKLASVLEDWANFRFNPGIGKLSIPKFSYEVEISLNKSAEAMGLRKIFDGSSKPFLGLTDDPVYIGDIKQASKIAVDEKGCSASSYTEVRAFISSGRQEKVDIILNRPFIYVLIKDKLPFFIGVVRNPLMG